METVAFLETTGDRHTVIVAGLTALERRIREVAKAGATRAVIAAAPVAIARPLPIPVEYVAPGSPAPEGVPIFENAQRRSNMMRGSILSELPKSMVLGELNKERRIRLIW